MDDITNPRDVDSVARQPGAFGVGATNAGPGQINPELEDRFWRANFASRPYVKSDRGYEYYRPAFQHGWESRARYHGRTWAQAEPDVRREWETRYGAPPQGQGASEKTKSTVVGIWDEIKDAVKEGWEHAIHP